MITIRRGYDSTYPEPFEEAADWLDLPRLVVDPTPRTVTFRSPYPVIGHQPSERPHPTITAPARDAGMPHRRARASRAGKNRDDPERALGTRHPHSSLGEDSQHPRRLAPRATGPVWLRLRTRHSAARSLCAPLGTVRPRETVPRPRSPLTFLRTRFRPATALPARPTTGRLPRVGLPSRRPNDVGEAARG